MAIPSTYPFTDFFFINISANGGPNHTHTHTYSFTRNEFTCFTQSAWDLQSSYTAHIAHTHIVAVVHTEAMHLNYVLRAAHVQRKTKRKATKSAHLPKTICKHELLKCTAFCLPTMSWGKVKRKCQNASQVFLFFG